jgi:hypothetical protein
VNGEVPPVTAPIVIVPLALPQVEFIELKATLVGPPAFETDTVLVKTQLLASLTVTLYVPELKLP